MIKRRVIVLVVLLMFTGLFSIADVNGITGNFEVRSGGGGGGSIPISAIETGRLGAGFNVLTPKILGSIIGREKYKEKPFFSMPLTLVAPLIAVGILPTPTTPILHTLSRPPLESTPFDRIISKGVEMLSSREIENIHNLVATKVLENYAYSGSVIITRRNPPADSIAAVAYANYINAPILLTEENELPLTTLNAVKKLRSPNIIIIGGPSAVGTNLEHELKGITSVERIWGKDRYETAVKIASRIRSPEVIVITDGTNPSSDALYVAKEFSAPIVYVNGRYNVVPAVTKRYLLDHRKTGTGDMATWVVAGVDDGLTSELNAMYSLPEFLSKYRFVWELFRVGSAFFR